MALKSQYRKAGSGTRKQSRKVLYRLFPVLPSYACDAETDTDTISFPPVAITSVLTTGMPAPPAAQFQKWSRSVGALAGLFGATEVLFITESPTPWRFQNNDFPPAAQALQFLADHGIGRKFNGGIWLSIAALPLWLPHLLWLVRCNAALPAVYFTTPVQRFVATFCRYGNLHFYLLHEEDKPLLKLFIAQNQLQDITGSNCTDTFGETAIQGRQTIV